MKSFQTTREDQRVAWLTALAITIHIAESALPSPLPGVKPGLANVVTIAVLLRFGWATAAWVNLLRVVAGSLLLGTFLSPTFLLSLSGALASSAVLWFSMRLPGRGCSAVGHSVLAALSHMGAQFWVVYAVFMPLPGLLHLLPVMMTLALGFGLFNGILVHTWLTGRTR